MDRRALGEQGRTALQALRDGADPAPAPAALRLTVDPAGVPATAAIPDPAADFPPLGIGPEARAGLELDALRRENAALRDRVADLEHSLRQADRDRAAAVEAAASAKRGPCRFARWAAGCRPFSRGNFSERYARERKGACSLWARPFLVFDREKHARVTATPSTR